MSAAALVPGPLAPPAVIRTPPPLGAPRWAPAAQAGTGLVSAQVWEVAAPLGSAEHWFPIPIERGQVRPNTELRWTVLPEGTDDPDTRWESCAISVDVEFEDGGRLSDSGAIDQYGGAIDARAQQDSRRHWPDQWNLRRVDLTPAVGRQIVRAWIVLLASTRRTVRAFVDDVAVGAARPRPARGTPSVSTIRGTHSGRDFSRGSTAPLVGLPHGGVFALPMTDATSHSWPYSYAAHGNTAPRPALQAFATSHLPSPWIGDRGVFQLMPSPSLHPDCRPAERALAFDRGDEEAGPDRYRVRLEGGIEAELTAADFAIGLRLHYPSREGSLILDHHGRVTDLARSRRGREWSLSLLLEDRPGTPPHWLDVRVAGVVEDHVSCTAGRLSGHLIVAADERGLVDARVGLSTVDRAGATAQLRRAGSVDSMLSAARVAWDERLATVEVGGTSAEVDISLYSGLYRTFLYPNRYAEPVGEGELLARSPYSPGGIARGALSSTHGFWDSYRTAWPLLALLTPTAAGSLATGFVRHAELSGWTPRWSAPGAVDSMTGTMLDVVLADLAVKRVPGIDLHAGYDTALRNATVPATDVRFGRTGLAHAIFRGYVDTGVDEGLCWTLDNAINDWGAAQLARLTPRSPDAYDPWHDWSAEAEYLARRSLHYRNVFDRERGFFIGRDDSGAWRTPFDPDEWGRDYTETNAWGTAFTAPHDGVGLATLHGGERALGRKLDRFFARPETAAPNLVGHYGFVIHEMREAREVRMGMLGLSNQPAHHIPFMYMFAGRHDDAHRIVRECLDRLFVGSDLGQGYPGDEDNGEMSAWYVFASIGLYPLAPATGSYVLLPPSIPRTTLRPIGTDTVSTIAVIDPDPRRRFIRSVRVDGEPWNDIAIPHTLLASGVSIDIETAAEPCGWASDSRPVSASDLHGYRDTLTDLTDRSPGGAAAQLVDDRGDRAVQFAAADSVVIPLVERRPVSLVTVTGHEPGSYAFRIDLLDAAARTIATRTDDDARFRWPRQTRAFRLDSGGLRVSAIRLTALRDLALRQIEAFARDASGSDWADLPPGF